MDLSCRGFCNYAPFIMHQSAQREKITCIDILRDQVYIQASIHTIHIVIHIFCRYIPRFLVVFHTFRREYGPDTVEKIKSKRAAAITCYANMAQICPLRFAVRLSKTMRRKGVPAHFKRRIALFFAVLPHRCMCRIIAKEAPLRYVVTRKNIPGFKGCKKARSHRRAPETDSSPLL